MSIGRGKWKSEIGDSGWVGQVMVVVIGCNREIPIMDIIFERLVMMRFCEDECDMYEEGLVGVLHVGQRLTEWG